MERLNIIITGASRGIGTYIARALAARGANLLLVARSQPELASIAHELRTAGAKVATAAVDLAAPNAAEEIAGVAAAELCSVDVLVNNAAVELQRRFHTIQLDDIETVVRVDLITPIALSRLLLPGMLERGYGRIINISSLAGHVGFPFTEAYAASKDGLTAFSRVLRNDYRTQGVSASAIVLGAVKEAGIGQRTLDELGLKTNTRFMASPDQVAQAVLRAIEKDKAEIVVMPGPGRLLKAVMDRFPSFGPAMTRISGGERLERFANRKLISRSSPPPGRAWALTSALCAAAIAATMARPSPSPSRNDRGFESRRWKGWKRRGSSCVGTCGPVLATERTARFESLRVATLIRPPATLWRIAFEMRFATRRSSRSGSPVVEAASKTSMLSSIVRS